ncbi:C-5 cytosine-specific DNA methylase [Acinetobacter calcoaceticus RUH2202]|uniref:DNA cytosine methyltransferase n=1 Tax=Acinetobacter calcoaceticus TaxID=471 RepID=UPI0001BB536D|nr:DNA cytosine methyltransferase [Acinetobacter calcoaceticus]EEY78931.1 C-5 cytosine-specific DNA methylase [Acinetobacter calcoaceticus RUH2202]
MNNFVKASHSFKTQFDLNFSEKIIVDFFAGGGGASTGLEMGLNRPVHVAVNHNPKAIAMHEANHPHAKHYVQDVFAVDPVEICDGYQVGWFHASPDCTHHSQAAGGQPRKKEIRDLSWVVLKFAGKVKPDVISLENVEQILNWGPLIAKRDKATGRVITLEKIEVNGKKVHRVAEPGEHVPRDNQFLVPDPSKKGKTWCQFVRSLERLGYVVEWKKIIAADHSAPTIRKRLFMVARCDGQAIVWPEATHAKKPKRGQKKWREAAECIDFSDLGNSIFDRPKPLVDATLRRVARGMKKLVLDAKKPYIVKNALPFIGRDFNTSFGHAINEPLGTTTAGYGGHSSLVSPIIAPFLTEFANASHQRNWGIFEPLTTICAQVKGGHHGLVSAVFTQAYYGEKSETDHRANSLNSPLNTITTENRHSLVSATLSKENLNDALRVAAFLINYYGNGDARDITAPIDTLTTKDRLALVTVWVKGEPWVIIDIKMRMLYPRELYTAQGFPLSYIIDRGHDGKPLTKTEQVHMCGNSVSPEPMAAIARANNPFETQQFKLKGAA